MTYETLFIGLLIAVLYVEITGFYPGGIIVPAYVALYLDQPVRVLATIVIAFLSLYIYRALSRFIILFGKRRFVMLVFIGAFLAQLWFLRCCRLVHCLRFQRNIHQIQGSLNFQKE